MMELVWTPRANRVREAAIDFIAQDDPIAALGQLDEIEYQTDLLPYQTEMGRPGRVKGTRELVINGTPFIVVYRVKPRLKRIEVIHFLHGAQQWPKV
ncbi:type II toxin-antitoxin system RelE/ParE family toxin [Photorhabdus namnaonensis]|uniref:Plasmid stabilization system protein n=1 Tax=Photorhabdus namnaonensis TaxID=1851568 RepID=A0A1B8YEI3_9GAMM|nr:type II toxin-antitoxin system RelE/ParE family toxin [Photorhabdus namnaonensis]OCA53553.1 Plasmid stabilization system protein [Photorhabdus namnaonensis]